MIRAVNIEQWADTLEARSVVPALLRRLVHATVPNADRVDFPAYEGVQRPGWDGIVATSQGTAFAPGATSLWEIGTNERIREKANGDYAVRTENPLGYSPADCEFIFVTPRKWTVKHEWCNEKNAERIWKNVRVYDSDDLEQWLEGAPAVGLWLARLLGLRTAGVWDIEHHWGGLSAMFNPAIRPDVIVASRGEEEAEFLQWLDETPGALVIESRAPTEAVDFVVAAIMRLPEEKQERVLASSVVIESREAFDALRDSTTPLLFVVQPHLAIEPELLASAAGRGHRSVLAATRLTQENTRRLRLPRIYRHDLETALERSGFSQVDAEKAARAAGGSIAILKRRLGSFPDGRLPAWAKEGRAHTAIPFLWIGGWNDTVEGDREIVSSLAGTSYDTCERTAVELAECHEPLLIQVLGNWSLLSKDDAWMLLSRFSTEEEFRRFLNVVATVLSEDDPQFDLSADERFYARIRGQVCQYSGLLRKSIAETLALLAALAETLELPATWRVTEQITAAVRQVAPKGCSWKRWASLRDVLPLLAEAAPEAVLEAMEADVGAAEPAILTLLAEEGNGLLSGCYHAGVLWALEGLAWSPAYLTRVCRVLLDLASRDKGGRWANRPSKTLAEIFSPWYPQTIASASQRIQVVDVLLSHNALQARKILRDLLPDSMATAMPTHHPYWRDWAVQWTPGATAADYWLQVNAYAERFIDGAGDDARAWEDVIGMIERIPTSLLDRVINGLRMLAAADLSSEERQHLSTVLRKKVSRHRSYPDAHWVLPENVVDSLDEVRKLLESDDPVLRHQWLFVPHPEPYIDSDLPYEQIGRNLRDARLSALRDVLAAGGFDAVLRFARCVESPETVGGVVAVVSGDTHLPAILPALLGTTEDCLRKFALGFAVERHYAEGWPWFDGLGTHAWLPEAAAKVLANLPFEPEAWERARDAGEDVTERYWMSVGAWNPRLSGHDVEHAIQQMIHFGRADRVLLLVSIVLHNGQEISTETLLSLLEGIVAGRVEDAPPQRGDNWGYHLLDLVKELQKRSDADEKRLAAAEWALLPLFRFQDASPVTLHRWLETNPDFFVELLRCAYRSKNEPVSEEPPSELAVQKAKHAYDLLHSWGRLPGTDKDGVVDAGVLREWVDAARGLAEASGHLEMCDISLGQLFAKSPVGADGAWPCEAVRRVFESGVSDQTKSGFGTGILNAVGLVTKAPHEGGRQERERAERYDGWAKAIEITSPLTAALLRRAAERFREDGRREDEEAQWDG